MAVSFVNRMSNTHRNLEATLEQIAQSIFNPDTHKKKMRHFSSKEVSELIGITEGYLRKLNAEGHIPPGEKLANNNRVYSVDDIEQIRLFLSKGGKSTEYWKRRREGEECIVLGIANFKGGSAKTTTSIHLAQRLALEGLRVLAVDLDPQGSLTSLMGLSPLLLKMEKSKTLYDAIKYTGEPCEAHEAIRSTHLKGLDIAPADLRLQDFEQESLMAKQEMRFYEQIEKCVGAVRADYDVIVLDFPPQLGDLAMNAMVVVNALIVTVHPQMLDVMSMSTFHEQLATFLSAAEQGYREALNEPDWTFQLYFVKYLLTRYSKSEFSQSEISDYLRQLLGDDVLKAEQVQSAAITEASMRHQTLYEIDKPGGSKQTYNRAMESMNAVNTEILGLITDAWGRKNG